MERPGVSPLSSRALVARGELQGDGSTHLHYGHLAGVAAPDRFFRSAHTRLAQRLHPLRRGEERDAPHHSVIRDSETLHSSCRCPGMPRQSRSWSPGAGAHTISRFIDRRFTLVADADRHHVLECIELANDRWDWVWLSYAFMSTHLHYGHLAGVAAPDRFFRSAHTRLAQRLHRCTRNQTLGPVFADRPTIHHVRPELLPRLVAYHHRNPVEAGLVLRPSQSNWTTHRAYLRLDPAPPWLNVERALDILGFADTAAGRRRFDEFVIELDLGGRPFEHPPRHATERVARAHPRNVDWTQLIGVARDLTSVPSGVPLHSKNRAATRARLLVAIVATADFGRTHADVAQQLGLTSGSVCNLISRGMASGGLELALEQLRVRLVSE